MKIFCAVGVYSHHALNRRPPSARMILLYMTFVGSKYSSLGEKLLLVSLGAG